MSVELRIISLFPDIFEGYFATGLMAKACQAGSVRPQIVSLREHGVGRHRAVDDSPYGGGAGMVLRADVLFSAWNEARQGLPDSTSTILLTPQGQVFDHQKAVDLGTQNSLILICGQYEGVDERFVEACVDQEISIGDYVLRGGELPALVLIDAMTRHLPGLIGNAESVEEDCFSDGLLKYPQYTRPAQFEGREVPGVLLGGDHQAIDSWRKQKALERTQARRPDLIASQKR